MAFSEQDLAWASGFFDGEGSVSIGANTFRGPGTNVVLFLSVTITNTDLVALERFAAIVGGGNIYNIMERPNRKKSYSWRASSKTAADVVDRLLKYSVVKQKQLTLAKEFRSLQQHKPFTRQPIEDKDRMLQIAIEMRGLNGNHHQKSHFFDTFKEHIDAMRQRQSCSA